MHDQETPAPFPSAALVRSKSAREKLIVALDFPESEQALHFVERLDGICQWFKVGLELYLSAGGGIVTSLRNQGYSVFLDLKFHDIPNTVAGAVRSVSPLGAQLLTVHASGGPAMLTAAAEAAASSAIPPLLLAVTVLTSMDSFQLNAVGVPETPARQAVQLATMARASGIHGFVCSPEEAPRLRAVLPDTTLVTPGIRPAGSKQGDQARIATPANALAAGADYLVVGRPITQADDPVAATKAILDEMSGCMEEESVWSGK